MKILKNLISIHSVSGNEEKIQKFIFRYLKKLDLKPLLVGGNIVVKIKGKTNSAIIFNSHVDTVPAGDLKLWKAHPFAGKTFGDKIFGLGASDEKSAVATLLLLAKHLSKNKPPCDVYITFVVKEELDGSGTKEFVEWFSKNLKTKYKKIAAVLGEPTGLKEIEIAHKGNIFLKVTTYGDSGHGSKPEEIRKHAVYEMYKVAEKLRMVNQRWSKKYKNNLLGKPTIGHLTSISAGSVSSPNKFPESCSATFDIRTTPELHNLAIKELKKEIKGYDANCVYPPVSFGYTDPDSGIVKIFQKITKAKVGVSEASNDMCFFTQANIPAVVFGPGEKVMMHKPNEYCEISKIKKCIKMYKEAIIEFSNT